MRSLLLLLLLPNFLTAQSAFLQDKNIVWAAEIEQDWIIDGSSLSDEYTLGLKTLKLLRTEQNEDYWENSSLAELVYHAASTGALPIYDDMEFLQPADPVRVLSKSDTVVTFNPETYEETVRIVRTDFDGFKQFKAWRLRQVLYYNKKTPGWNTVVIAIAPLLQVCCNDKDSVAYKPAFWFKPNNERPNLGKKEIVWAKMTRNKQPGTLISINQPHMLKVLDGFQNPAEHNFGLFKSDPKGQFYASWEDKKPMPIEDRLSLVSKIDTVVTFDPETYEEKVIIVRNDVNPADVNFIRLYQTWYWDERKNRLSICSDQVGPMVDVLDYDGNFKFSRTLYYLKIK